MVSIGFFNTIKYNQHVFVLSLGGECFGNDAYVNELKSHNIKTVVNTVEIRPFSPNVKLDEAGIEEVPLPFMTDYYIPLPSQLNKWLTVLRESTGAGRGVAADGPGGSKQSKEAIREANSAVAVAVHGLPNGSLLVAIGLMELGLGLEAAKAKVLEAQGEFFEDHIHFLSVYTPEAVQRLKEQSKAAARRGKRVCTIL